MIANLRELNWHKLERLKTNHFLKEKNQNWI